MLNNDRDLAPPQWEPARSWNPTQDDDTGSRDPFLYAGPDALSDDGSVGSAGSGSTGRGGGGSLDSVRRNSLDNCSVGSGHGGGYGSGYGSAHNSGYGSGGGGYASGHGSVNSGSQHSACSHQSAYSHHSHHSHGGSPQRPAGGHYDHVRQPHLIQHQPPASPRQTRPMNRRGSNDSASSYECPQPAQPPYDAVAAQSIGNVGISHRHASPQAAAWHTQQSPPAGLYPVTTGAGMGPPPPFQDSSQASRVNVKGGGAPSALPRRVSGDDFEALASFGPGPGLLGDMVDSDECALYDCAPNITRPFSKGFLKGKYGILFVLGLVGIFAHAEFGWRSETLRRAGPAGRGAAVVGGGTTGGGGGAQESMIAKDLEAKYRRQQRPHTEEPAGVAGAPGQGGDSRNMHGPAAAGQQRQPGQGQQPGRLKDGGYETAAGLLKASQQNLGESAATSLNNAQLAGGGAPPAAGQEPGANPAGSGNQQGPSPASPEAAPGAAAAAAAASTTAETATGMTRPLPKVDPPALPGLKDISEAPNREKDVLIFWHIPKAGGSTVKDIVGTCHARVVANEIGVLDGHDKDTKLEVTKIDGQGETLFVNVDTTTLNGIYRARDMGLGPSGLAGLIVTPFLKETSTLFDPRSDRKGRVFATFRHPLDRVVSLFKYLQYAEWEPTYDPKLKEWSLEKYAESERIENNWMTRHLTSTYDADLTDVHLAQAIEVMRTKILVGLMNRMEESMNRFETYFGLKYTLNPTEQESCREGLFTVGTNIGGNTDTHAGEDKANYNKIEKPKPGSKTYGLIMEQNNYDMELYKYAVNLFEEQEGYVKGQPEEFRLVGSTCSKCEQYEEAGRKAEREQEERERQRQRENEAAPAGAGAGSAVSATAKRVLSAILA